MSVRPLLRSLVLLTFAITAISAPPTTAAAADDVASAPKPQPLAQGGNANKSRGYDISWPQCGNPYPVNPAFGIVGVNRGIVFSPNPCLASEITWGGGARTQLYAN